MVGKSVGSEAADDPRVSNRSVRRSKAFEHCDDTPGDGLGAIGFVKSITMGCNGRRVHRQRTAPCRMEASAISRYEPDRNGTDTVIDIDVGHFGDDGSANIADRRPDVLCFDRRIDFCAGVP